MGTQVMEALLRLWQLNRGRIIGAAAGFFIAVLILSFGFFRTLFIIFCMIAGYAIGQRIDDKEDIAELLDRILPPGYHR